MAVASVIRCMDGGRGPRNLKLVVERTEESRRRKELEAYLERQKDFGRVPRGQWLHPTGDARVGEWASAPLSCKDTVFVVVL